MQINQHETVTITMAEGTITMVTAITTISRIADEGMVAIGTFTPR